VLNSAALYVYISFIRLYLSLSLHKATLFRASFISPDHITLAAYSRIPGSVSITLAPPVFIRSPNYSADYSESERIVRRVFVSLS
jgi:hypothetical protein